MKLYDDNQWTVQSSLKVSISAFGPGDPDSNPGWIAVSISNGKLSFHKVPSPCN